MNGHSI